MSWHILPAELHLAIVHILPQNDTRALSLTSWSAHDICLPAIFANVILPDSVSLLAFARHVPPRYGPYVRSLAISTKGPDDLSDPILAILTTCTRLSVLSLSLASPITPEKLVPAFASLRHVHTFQIGSSTTEDVSPVSERLVVALAASLPSLSHLTLNRITRSAIHIDPCDIPFNVPVVTNDFDVPPHPRFGSHLSLPNLLRIPSLRSLEILDTWLGCDSKIDARASSSLQNLVLTGSMYSSESQSESLACSTWLHACPSLHSFHLGSALAPLPHPSSPPRVSHVHINASRIPVDDLSSTLDALASCHVQSISIAYGKESHSLADISPFKSPPDDDFTRQCALDDLQDWSAVLDAWVPGRSQEAWSSLSHIDVSFAQDIAASWDF
ncbi:hypothetical protein JVU11DRAFT_8019 [Chiua virens]|nr:hypothetical protein JVU11DRAFT_8019 [Chiua virens]